MVAIILSLLFGFVAMGAVAAIRTSIQTALRSARRILEELEQRSADEAVAERQALHRQPRLRAPA